MPFTPTYHDRNIKNLAQLGDHTKIQAVKWYKYLIENKIDVLIYETIRTREMQREYLQQGASQTMESFHIVGQALDFVPVKAQETSWNSYRDSKIKKAISYAKSLGFEWGGDWKDFVDQPHLQYKYKGYGTDTFKTKGDKIILSDTKKTSTSTSKKPTYSLPTGVYKKGDKGNGVKQIQAALNKLNFNCGTPDGIWGAKTEDAFRRFQSVYCNPVDGIYGTKTRSAMLKQLNK
ncbi:peptidoglycan-binding protein [Niallia nealsonii]|uniref:Uncharacterized protein n=1 Tax=Niallia nealsonii TaxID=115979 RepID=A0A2N0Z041_9BACI|nr:peptidoglycan-binding protein [Niallia nealsonii]PKG22882.1 hypothetical protein CWS01_14465 [Niallia nealsonii]